MDTNMTADDVMSLKVSELKSTLSGLGLETAGIKSSLQKRLIAHFEKTPSGMEVESAPATTDTPTTDTPTDDKDEETIDETVRYKGTVAMYQHRRGFGTITPEGKEDSKENNIFVHWRQIQSADEWPALRKGMSVEYYIGDKKNPRRENQKKFAAKVTLEGGEQVTIPKEGKVYPDKSMRFHGIVKFFDARKGFGFVTPKEDFCFEENDFTVKGKSKIYVAREDIKCAADVDTAPSLKEKAEIEFTLYKREKAAEGKVPTEETQWGAGDVTLPGGAALTTTDFKPRFVRGKRNHKKQGGKRKFNQFKGMQIVQMGGGMPMMMGGGMPMMMGNQHPMMFNMGGQKKKRKNKKRKQNMAAGQIMMMNGVPYMIMPANMVGGGKKKRRRKNKSN